MSPIVPWMMLGCVVAASGVVFAGLVVSRRRLAAELAAVRERFRGYMDHGPFLAFMKDADGRYVYENLSLAEHIARIRPGITTCIGRTDRDLFPVAEEQAYVGNDRQVIERGAPQHFDEVSVDADGTVRYWSTVKFPRRDERGRVCIAGISIDVTEAQRARKDARVTADRCALAIEAGRMGTLALDLATQTLETSPLFAVLHGRPETRTRLSLAESLEEVHPDDRQLVHDAVQAALQGRAPSRVMYRVTKADGRVSWVELMGQVYCDDLGRPTVVRGVGYDVTERQASFEAINRQKTVLRRLIEVQENERRMLCHELHDGLLQYAIGATMLLEAASDSAESPDQAARIAAALECLGRGIAEGRQVIRGVRSAVLDDLGLAAAVYDLADQMSSFGIKVDVGLDDDLDSIPASLLTTVYRVVQESLANVRKHADTDHAIVEIRLAADHLDMCVSDAGKGFDVAEARTRGFGFEGMTERVRVVGGDCTITARPGAGTRIHVRLPIRDDGSSGPPSTAPRCELIAPR